MTCVRILSFFDIIFKVPLIDFLFTAIYRMKRLEEFKEKDPALDEIICRYFIDDKCRCTRQ